MPTFNCPTRWRPARPKKSRRCWLLRHRQKGMTPTTDHGPDLDWSCSRQLFNRLGEMRNRTLENQRYRASGLNLVVAAIILWNTVYLERAIRLLQQKGRSISDELLVHLSPLGWEHINFDRRLHLA